MSHHTSESYILELAEKVRRFVENHPRYKTAAQVVLATSEDKSKPVEFRKQILLHFLNRHKEVDNACH